jgi:hypothetical protein
MSRSLIISIITAISILMVFAMLVHSPKFVAHLDTTDSDHLSVAKNMHMGGHLIGRLFDYKARFGQFPLSLDILACVDGQPITKPTGQLNQGWRYAIFDDGQNFRLAFHGRSYSDFHHYSSDIGARRWLHDDGSFSQYQR